MINAGARVVRILPALNIEDEHVYQAVAILRDCVAELAEKGGS